MIISNIYLHIRETGTIIEIRISRPNNYYTL